MKLAANNVRRSTYSLLVFLLCGFSLTVASGQGQSGGHVGPDGRWHETEEVKQQRIEWRRHAKFGMFIHSGVYSIPAGSWKGKDYKGYSEWLMWKARIPVNEYEHLPRQSDPVKFNAEQWVQLAKAAQELVFRRPV